MPNFGKAVMNGRLNTSIDIPDIIFTGIFNYLFKHRREILQIVKNAVLFAQDKFELLLCVKKMLPI